MEGSEVKVKVRAVDATSGEPITFSELRSIAVRCGPTQHDYQQGMDAIDRPDKHYANLLYCRNCGDVIAFSLPVEESIE